VGICFKLISNCFVNVAAYVYIRFKCSNQYSSFDHVDSINQNKKKVTRNNFNLLDANPYIINNCQQGTNLGDVYTNYNCHHYNTVYTR